MQYLPQSHNESDQSQADRSPIFVVGTPRSGTTLLGLLLNAHPHVAVLGELHFFDQILAIRKRVPSLATDADLELFSTEVHRTYNFQFLLNGGDLLSATIERMKQNGDRTYEAFYRYVLDEFARRERAARPAEKTPTNLRHIDRIIAIFPNAKIIHIVRDPRAVAASLSRMPWASYGVLVNALKWKLDALATRKYRGHRNTYLRIAYEELVSQPRSSLTNLCRFLELPYTDAMLQYYKTQAAYVKGEPWKDGTRRPINTENVTKWRHELSQHQVNMIQVVTRQQMNEFGYDLLQVPFTTKIVSPFHFVLEILRYLRFKVKQRQLRARHNPSVQYFGESRSLWIGALRSIFHM